VRPHIGLIYFEPPLTNSKFFDCHVKSIKVTAATGMEQIGDALKGCKVVVIPAGVSHASELICSWNCILFLLIPRLFISVYDTSCEENISLNHEIIQFGNRNLSNLRTYHRRPKKARNDPR
jgi:hypothetical protein